MNLIRIAEKIFVVISLFLFSDAIISLFREGQTDSGRLFSPTAILFYGIQIISIVLMLLRWKQVLPVLLRTRFLWILLALILLSAAWSISPSTSLSYDLKLFRLTTFGIYIATSFNFKEQVNLLAWTLGFAAVLSIFCALLLPEYGLMGGGGIENGLMAAQGDIHYGAWQGVYSHKNMLGRFMCLAVIIFWIVANYSSKWSLLGWACVVMSSALILLSTSTSALIITVAILALLPIYKIFRWQFKSAFPVIMGMAIVGSTLLAVLFSQQSAIFIALGKDPTLTGRSDIWEAVMENIRAHLWLGFGYSAFWSDESEAASTIWSSLGWEFKHSHNGFLDLTLDIGLVGLIIFLIGFSISFSKAIKYAHLNKTSIGLFPITFLTFLIFANVTESVILRPSVIWLIYVVVTISLEKKEEYLSNQLVRSQPRKITSELAMMKAKPRLPKGVSV